MLDPTPSADLLDHLRSELGVPILTLTFSDGERAVRSALRRRDGSLVAVLTEDEEQVGVARSWFAGAAVPVEVEQVQVCEGWLAVGRATAAALAPERQPVPGARLEDLDAPWVAQWLRATDRLPDRAAPVVGTARERALGAIGVLALDGRIWRPTVAALVVGGRRPELFLPGCAVQVDVDGRRQVVQGAVTDLLRGVETGDLDPWVVREALVNAILHRSWSTDAPIVLRVAGARLDLTNPGRLRRAWPNPLVMALATAVGIVRGERAGLRRVAERLERTGQRPFSLIAREGTVRFVAELGSLAPQRPPRPPPVQTSRDPPPPPVEVAPVVVVEAPLPAPAPPVVVVGAAPPTDRDAAVLDLLRQHGRRTTREIAAALGCSRPVVGKVLTRLVAEGAIRAVAERKSPFQAYELSGRREVAGGGGGLGDRRDG